MPETDKIPKTPKGLRSSGRRFWKQILTEYEFPNSPEMLLLVEEAARTADVVSRLQEVIDTAETLRTTGSRNQDVAIPELDALRAYRTQFAALVKQLDLPGPAVEEQRDLQPDRVTPMTRSEAARVAAAARWNKCG